MGDHRPRGSTSCRPRLEALEARRVPAQFGVPWHDAQHLTLSFVPDGTPIAAHRSNLFQALDAGMPTAAWQREILRAFQTWAVAAPLNFALEADGGQSLGVPGPNQADSRFGDIRIAARPMPPEVLSISVPHDPFLSGTWSGDVLLNGAVAFEGDALFSVLLHEVGHVLGIDHSPDPGSAMFSHLDPRRTGLAPGDVAAVRALYGPRPPDRFEGADGNEVAATASPLPAPSGFDGSTPLMVYGDVSTHRDVDVFSVRPPAGVSGPVTIRLQTAGVSLLTPRLTVTDATGQVLGDIASRRLGGDTLQAQLPAVDPDETYLIEVRGATEDVFGIGEYALAVTFDARSTIGPGELDAFVRQTYSYLDPGDIDAIFRDPRGALFRDDHHADDTFATPSSLAPVRNYGARTPHRAIASLGDGTDLDVYQVKTPGGRYVAGGYPDRGDTLRRAAPGEPLVMTVMVRATVVNGIQPRVAVFDGGQGPVPALVLAHGGGTATIQVADARPDAAYFIRVAPDPASGKVVGNYDLEVHFGHIAARPISFVSSTLDDATPQAAYRLVVNQTQLFHFLLSASDASPGAAVRMTLVDGRGRPIATRRAGVGGTAGGHPLLLVPGVYRATFAAEAPGGDRPPPITFRLFGASLTDPIGPASDDPTLTPVVRPTSGDPRTTFPSPMGSRDSPYYWMALGLDVPRRPDDLPDGPANRKLADRPGGADRPPNPDPSQDQGAWNPVSPLERRVPAGPGGRDFPAPSAGRVRGPVVRGMDVEDPGGQAALVPRGVPAQGGRSLDQHPSAQATAVAEPVDARPHPRLVATIPPGRLRGRLTGEVLELQGDQGHGTRPDPDGPDPRTRRDVPAVEAQPAARRRAPHTGPQEPGGDEVPERQAASPTRAEQTASRLEPDAVPLILCLMVILGTQSHLSGSRRCPGQPLSLDVISPRPDFDRGPERGCGWAAGG